MRRFAPSQGCSAACCTPTGTRIARELYELELPAQTDHRRDPHLPGTEELVVCIAGRMTVGPLGEEVELRAGDAVRFVADVDHRYATGRAPARALNLLLYPAAAR